MFEPTQTAYADTLNSGGAAGFWPYLVFGLALVIVTIVLMRRFTVFRRSKIFKSLDLVFLEVQVPRESSEDKFGQESTKQNEKELIGIGEQLFTTVNFPPAKWWERFWYGYKALTFEIACYDKKIHFIISCPRSYASVIERGIHSQYPKAIIEEVAPYRLFKKGGSITAAEMVL